MMQRWGVFQGFWGIATACMVAGSGCSGGSGLGAEGGSAFATAGNGETGFDSTGPDETGTDGQSSGQDVPPSPDSVTSDGVDDTTGGTDGTGPDASTGEADEGESSGSSTGGMELVPTLNQAAFNSESGAYEFGFQSIPTLPIDNGPLDADWTRWAMAHDGTDYRLFVMREGTDDTLYQYGYDVETQSYAYGLGGTPTVSIVGAPGTADPSSFAVLHDGETLRLYMLSDSGSSLHQFGFDPAADAFEYGHLSIPEVEVSGTPAGADWSGWGMLHDGERYRLYGFASAAHDTLVQHAYDPSTQRYEYAFQSIPQVAIELVPADSDTADFGMLHDGDNYRFYFLTM